MQTLPLFSVPVIIDHLDINSSKLREEKCYVTNESGEDRPFDHYRILEKYPKIKNALLDRFKNIAKNVLYHNKNNFIITTSWLTKTVKDEISQSHPHKNSFFSGIYYYYGNYNKNTAGLEFNNPHLQLADYYLVPEEYTMMNCDTWKIQPQHDMVVFFPSYLNHRILIHKDDDPRYSLAFNIVPIGQYGDRDSSSNTRWT